MIVDHTNGRILEIPPDRDKASVLEYLCREKEAGPLAAVEEVTCDMWDAYVNAATEAFGAGVRVTIDRFHVMKNLQEQLTKARREIQRELDKEEAKELKGTRWSWVKNRENLTSEELARLLDLGRRYPRLGRLADRRERLRELFEDRSINTSAAGERRLRQWMSEAVALGLKGLDAFCRTLSNWLGMIANYFVSRSTNGRTEGYNHGLRSILWRAFGLTNFDNFRRRVLARFGKPKLA